MLESSQGSLSALIMLLGPAQHHVMVRATRQQGTQVNTQLSLEVEVRGRRLSKVLGND